MRRKKKGFAEADPTTDVEGIDTAHKLALLARLAFDGCVNFKKVHIEGITKLSEHDFTFAKRLGRTIKLVGVAKLVAGQVELRVHPTLLPTYSALAKISGSINAVSLYGPNINVCTLSGPGAGSLPTATAVVGDLIELARTAFDSAQVPVCTVRITKLKNLVIKPIDAVFSKYYLRFVVKDSPGVIRDVSRILAKYKLNIRDFLQLDYKQFKNAVPMMLILSTAQESILRKAVRELDLLPCMKTKTVVLRVEG